MRILVTGATGFIGRHVVGDVVLQGHEVLAVARTTKRLTEMPWRNEARFLACDIYKDNIKELLAFAPDVLVHLAWPGLPNYQQSFHFEENLPLDYRFLKLAIESGIKQITVTGTGAEFGLASGSLAEDANTSPVSAYGVAKDSLRRFLQHLEISHPFVLQWVRLFYIYGPGQNPGSLLAQLDHAIQENRTEFDMSGGEQLRDYLSVQSVSRRLSILVEQPDLNGVINCCSGVPISIRSLVERRIKELGANIKLNLGSLPYSNYESLAYWGKVGKIERISHLIQQNEPF